jgi:AhpD family alkylhydroperoxidase
MEMSRITAPENHDDLKVEKIFREIEGAFGMVPNLFRTYAHFPPLLEANWNKVKAVMMGGTLSRKVKDSIAVLVSKDNGCDYCVAAHETALRASEYRLRRSGSSRRTWPGAPLLPRNKR